MNITAADWLPYQLPLRQPWASAVGSISQRQGKLLRLQTDCGLTGWGDCAPLPEYGIDENRATAYAEQSALLDLAAQKGKRSLADWLNGRPTPRRLRVNAMAGPLHRVKGDDLVALTDAGFTVIKLKVGLAPPEEELACLKNLIAQLPPGISLRLDANRAWDEATARRFLAACHDWPIDGIEEPLRTPTPEALRQLQASIPFPLAIDESDHLLDAAFFDNPPIKRLTLKPPRQGSPLAALQLGLQARAAGLECLLTSSLESACGLLMAAHLAVVLAPGAVHGLATSAWMLADTGAAPRIENGVLCLPENFGVGFVACPV